jgi:hypothetical protein
MPGNLTCDLCNKRIGDCTNAYFSDREKDLDFCSESCCSAWGNSDEFATQFKKCRMPGNRVDRSLKSSANLDEIIGNYKGKSISGATAGLVYSLWVEPNEIALLGITEYNDRIFNLTLSNDLKVFTRDKSEIINPLNGNNWEDGGLSDKEKALYIGETLNTSLSIHAAAVLLAHLRAIKDNQRLDGREGQEGNDDWTGENNQEFINRLTYVDEEHRLALEEFSQTSQISNNANETSEQGRTENSIRNILLIGRTGSGKSTLGNVLINEFKDNEQFREIFKESAGSVSETKNVQVQEFMVNLREDGSEKIRYLVSDTAGFSDTQLTTKEVLQLLQELVKYIGNDGINQIFLVNSGRFTGEEIDIYRLLESVLFDQEVARYTTIVRTRFPDFENENECEADRQSLRRENNELFNLIDSAKIIYVDNPPLVGRPEAVEINREVRRESNKRLITYLGRCQEIYNPANLATLQQRINDYQTKTEQLQKELENKERQRQQRESQLQQEINSLQTQQQNEINQTQQNFNNQLNAVYADQQRQINEANARHQRELAEVRENYGYVELVTGFICPQGHRDGVGYSPLIDRVICYTCPQRLYREDECSIIARRIPLEDFVRISGEAHNENLRQLRQQIQDQEHRNQEQIARISQQISQRQQNINNQRWDEENRINQQYQQTENNLRSELRRREGEVQNAQQELNRIREQFEQHIEQKMPWWRR